MRYLLQIIVMLIGPFFIVYGIFVIIRSELDFFVISIALVFNYLAWKFGAWECWRPSVIKEFLKNAKKSGL